MQGLACSPFRRAVVGKFRKALCSDAHLVELRAPRLVRGPGSSSHLAFVFLVRLVTLWRVALKVVRVVQMATPNLVRQVLRLRIGEVLGILEFLGANLAMLVRLSEYLCLAPRPRRLLGCGTILRG